MLLSDLVPPVKGASQTGVAHVVVISRIPAKKRRAMQHAIFVYRVAVKWDILVANIQVQIMGLVILGLAQRLSPARVLPHTLSPVERKSQRNIADLDIPYCSAFRADRGFEIEVDIPAAIQVLTYPDALVPVFKIDVLAARGAVVLQVGHGSSCMRLTGVEPVSPPYRGVLGLLRRQARELIGGREKKRSHRRRRRPLQHGGISRTHPLFYHAGQHEKLRCNQLIFNTFFAIDLAHFCWVTMKRKDPISEQEPEDKS